MHQSSVSWEITLLYFFTWKCTWLEEMEPIKVQNFKLSTAHLKFQQICTLIASFCWKYIKFQLKKHRGVMSHDPEEWWKIWRKTDLFQKQQKFGEFWTEFLKVSQVCTLIGSYCAKYLIFDLKKYRGVIFHDTEELCKIWRKIDLWFGKWHEEFGKFLPEHWKVSKLELSWDPFVKNRKCMSLKFNEELCVMTMKNDVKIEDQLTCLFKNDMRNLTNFDPSTQKSPKFAL